MQHDMITVFNQLTQTELTDYSLFDSIICDHYEKYKYFYCLMENRRLDHIKIICCECPDNEMVITMEFDSKKKLKNFKEAFEHTLENAAHCYQHSEWFEVTLSADGSTLNISIENKNICREDEIYEDRSDTD